MIGLAYRYRRRALAGVSMVIDFVHIDAGSRCRALAMIELARIDIVAAPSPVSTVIDFVMSIRSMAEPLAGRCARDTVVDLVRVDAGSRCSRDG